MTKQIIRAAIFILILIAFAFGLQHEVDKDVADKKENPPAASPKPVENPTKTP